MEVPSSPRPRMRMCWCGFEVVGDGDVIVRFGCYELDARENEWSVKRVLAYVPLSKIAHAA